MQQLRFPQPDLVRQHYRTWTEDHERHKYYNNCIHQSKEYLRKSHSDYTSISHVLEFLGDRLGPSPYKIRAASLLKLLQHPTVARHFRCSPLAYDLSDEAVAKLQDEVTAEKYYVKWIGDFQVDQQDLDNWDKHFNPLHKVPDIAKFPVLNTEQKKRLITARLDVQYYNQVSSDIQQLYKDLCIPPKEAERRHKIAQQLCGILRKNGAYSDSQVELFGSSANGLAIKGGDADMMLHSRHLREIASRSHRQTRKQQLAREVHRIANILRRSGYKNIEPISYARIPLIRFVHPSFDIDCDLTVIDSNGRCKTSLFEQYTKADPRVRPLLFTLKRWIKRRQIGDASDIGGSTINSFTHTLMMLAFLQRKRVVPLLQSICCVDGYVPAQSTAQPDIDEHLSAHLASMALSPQEPMTIGYVGCAGLAANNTSTTSNGAISTRTADQGRYSSGAPASYMRAYWDDQVAHEPFPRRTCRVCSRQLPSSGTHYYTGRLPPSPNKESLGQLLYEFFIYYALQFNAAQDCVSIRAGSTIPRRSKGWQDAQNTKTLSRDRLPAAFCVEDPFELDRNCTVSSMRHVWAGLRWEYERAARQLHQSRGLDGVLEQYRKWPLPVFAKLGIVTGV